MCIILDGLFGSSLVGISMVTRQVVVHSIALQRLLFQPNWPHKRGHSIAKGAKNRDKIKVAIRLSSERLLEGYQIPTQQGTYIKRRRRRLLQFHVYCVQHRIHIS